MIADFYSYDVEQYSNEFLLLADTYYRKKNYKLAKNLYHLLLTNVKELLVHLDIWLKYGNCCNYLNFIDDAINAFRNGLKIDELSRLIGNEKSAADILEVSRLVNKFCYFSNAIEIGVTYSPRDLSFSEMLIFSWIKDGLSNGRKT